MARTGRTNRSAEAGGKPPLTWRIAVYIRLSREDGNDESLSVTNQRKIILEHIEDTFGGEAYTITDLYVDDGRSGTTEDARPAFQKMVSDIESGRVNCVICKTLSRCFRNYSDQGRFLEQFLPLHGCRFIAISNPFVDTYADPDCTQNMEIPINGLMNDRYAARTSADIRRTFDYKRRRGEFIGAFAPYGFQKDPDDKNRLLLDEEAAQVKRDLYHWLLYEGMSLTGMAHRLNDLGVPNPTRYKQQKGFKYRNPHAGESSTAWTPTVIRRILTDRMNAGAMVQGKAAIVSYKVHKQVAVPAEDWFVVDGAVPATVPQEVFDAAQALLMRDTRTAPGRTELTLFAGFIRCADCKKAMHRRSASGGKYIYYTCRTFSDKSKELCTKHSIRVDVLEGAVLAAIQMQIKLASLEGVMLDIRAAPARRTETARLGVLMEQKGRELKEAIALIDGLYLDMKRGDLSREQYRRIKAQWEIKIQQLQEAMAYIKREYEAAAQDGHSEEPYLTAFLKYSNIQSLSRGLLIALVNTIYVHEDRSIHIVFQFSDPLFAYKRPALPGPPGPTGPPDPPGPPAIPAQTGPPASPDPPARPETPAQPE